MRTRYLLSSLALGCAVSQAPEEPRKEATKADVDLGVCAPDDCGASASDGAGFCDEECATFGDCAQDVREVCGFDECSVSSSGVVGCAGGGTCEAGLCESSLAWGLNDVSVLFPARAQDVPHLLGAVNEHDGAEVVLLDKEVFELLGTETMFLTETPNRDQHYPHLRVTSFRLDPCVDGFDPHAPTCERAVRLVMQPIWPVGSSFDIFDASIHLFFGLSESRWTALLADYDAIRTSDISETPLQVHPLLESQGMDGAFGVALNDLILEYATADRMTRMTFMATGRSGNNWFWGGFDRQSDGSFAHVQIPGVAAEDGFHQNGRDNPIPVVPTEGFPAEFLTNPVLDALDPQTITAGLQRLYELENPRLVNPTNVRCSWCHLAAETKDHVLTRFDLEELDTPLRYHSEELDLTPPRTGDNRGLNMHGFSYFADQPTVSQRVVNDSAEVVHFLRTR